MSEDKNKRKRRIRRDTPSSSSKKPRPATIYAFDPHDKRPVKKIPPRRVPYAIKAKNGRPKKKNQLNIVTILIFVLFIAYLSSYLIVSANKEQLVETSVIYGSVELPTIFDGIILRDEKVYTTDAAGTVIYNKANHDRIKKNTLVCDIQDSAAMLALETSLAEVHNSLIDMQEERKEYSIFQEDINKINVRIKKTLDNNSYRNTMLDISYVYELKKEIVQDMDIRNNLLLNENRGSLTSLINSKTQIESQMLDSKSNIIAQESGIISYTLDGLEHILTIDQLYNLTREQTTGKVDIMENHANKEVASGDSIFKVIRSNNWYIVSYLPNNMIEGWIENNFVTIYLSVGESFIPVDALLDRIEPKDNTYSYVVFMFTRQMIDYLEFRSIEFKLEDSVSEGLKIPNSAIAEKTLLVIPNKYIPETVVAGSGRNILKKTEEGTEEIPITITDSDDDFSYVLQDITTLKLGDIVVNAEDENDVFQIENIKNLKGVYVTNSGIDVFKKINTEGSISLNGYTVLVPELNNGVRVYDNIIADVKTMESNNAIRQ